MKFSVCQSPNKTEVMLPVSRTDRQTESLTDRLWLQLHSFFMQLALANETNLHFNMRYVNLEFKINRQGKRPALLLLLSSLFSSLSLSSVGNKLLVLCALCLQRVFMLEIRAGNAPKTGNNMM